MRLSERLKNKVAIVTGSGSGIGQGCALMFARHGARVMGCDINQEAAEETLAAAKKEGLDFETLYLCDLTDPENVKTLIEHTVERFGTINVLLNAAAWGAFAPIQEMDYETQWKRTLTGELDMVFLMCKTAWPHLIAGGSGSIINFASVNAWQVLENLYAVAHCAGKGGILAMTRQLAMEGAPHNIRANTISPGHVVTGATKPNLDANPAFKEMITAKHMLKRLGTPEDIAWCATYLASDESGWVTAADFAIDAGASKW